MSSLKKSDPIAGHHQQLVFLGPPGSGKGTQARLLAARFGFAHISTGVILRKQIRAGTLIGHQAKQFIDDGHLVPDPIVRSLAEDAIRAQRYQGFILDGYPRTLQQAQWLTQFLDSQGVSLTAVVTLVIEDEEVVLRLSQRRIHALTGENFHLSSKPPPEEESEYIVARPDDQPDAIRERLKVYHQQTYPLVEYYRSKDQLLPIDAVDTFSEVHSKICNHLNLV